MLRDCLSFISVRFGIIKYTSKSDKKISVAEGQTDRRTDGQTFAFLELLSQLKSGGWVGGGLWVIRVFSLTIFKNVNAMLRML